ncbi:hypothetical protein ES705_49650 [subsurface metagenome]
MRRCIICGEKDSDLLIKHHTIPRVLNPLWEKRIYLCQRCHKKTHKYIIKDLVDLVLGIKSGHGDMSILLNSRGFYFEKKEDVGVISRIGEIAKVLRILNSLIPKSDSRKRIYVDIIAKECNLTNQKVGYILKGIEIKRRRSRAGMYLYLTKANIAKISAASVEAFPEIDLSEPVKRVSKLGTLLKELKQNKKKDSGAV